MLRGDAWDHLIQFLENFFFDVHALEHRLVICEYVALHLAYLILSIDLFVRMHTSFFAFICLTYPPNHPCTHSLTHLHDQIALSERRVVCRAFDEGERLLFGFVTHAA